MPFIAQETELPHKDNPILVYCNNCGDALEVKFDTPQEVK